MSTLFMSWSMVVLLAFSFAIIVWLYLDIQKKNKEIALKLLAEKERAVRDQVNATSIPDLIAAENASASSAGTPDDPKGKP